MRLTLTLTQRGELEAEAARARLDAGGKARAAKLWVIPWVFLWIFHVHRQLSSLCSSDLPSGDHHRSVHAWIRRPSMRSLVDLAELCLVGVC